MRIILTMLLLTAALFLMPAVPVFAEDMGNPALYDMLDPAQISMPEEAAGFLAENGISQDAPESVGDLAPGAVLAGIWNTVKQEAGKPLKLCGSLLALVMLSALLQSIGDTAADGSMRRAAELIFTLICIGCAAKPLCTCIARTADTLHDGCVFMAGYVPVFSGAMAAGGAVGSGMTYQVFVFFLTELEAQLTGNLLFPLLQMACAVGIADAVNPSLRLGGLVDGFHSVLKWSLGFLISLFSAMLSIRSFVASAADSLASKTVRMLTAGFIPIVGGAVSESLGTLQGSLTVLRNGVGALGIIAILWMILPPVLSLIAYRLVFRAAGTAASMAGADTLAKLFQNAHTVLSAAFAMLVCFSLMLVFSTALMMILIRGGA